MDLRIEEREESCSIVSKVVRLKIFRRVIEGSSLKEGELVGYDCSASSSTCKTKCHYRLLIEDY